MRESDLCDQKIAEELSQQIQERLPPHRKDRRGRQSEFYRDHTLLSCGLNFDKLD